MTDLIRKARERWCEPFLQWCDPFLPRSTLSPPIWYPCPPEVVAALLDVLDDCREVWDADDMRVCCGVPYPKPHKASCFLALAEAAITRALEQKA